MPDCVFCQIVNKKIPAKIVFEDKTVLAFYDIKPLAKQHVLIIPKEHIEFIDLEKKWPDLPIKIFKAAKAIAKKLNIEQTGYRLVINNGSLAGQVVDHVHWHLLGGNRLGPIT